MNRYSAIAHYFSTLWAGLHIFGMFTHSLTDNGATEETDVKC